MEKALQQQADCGDCSAAAASVWAGYRMNCRQCAARMVSRSQQCFQARQRLRLTPEYRALLERMGVTHDEVKAAAGRDFEQRSAHV